jgi:hypothetical protein
MAGSWLVCLNHVRIDTRPKTAFCLHAAVEAEQALAIAVQVEVDRYLAGREGGPTGQATNTIQLVVGCVDQGCAALGAAKQVN